MDFSCYGYIHGIGGPESPIVDRLTRVVKSAMNQPTTFSLPTMRKGVSSFLKKCLDNGDITSQHYDKQMKRVPEYVPEVRTCVVP